ncbi:MAG: type I-F CRISPR-associated protein Csy3 [Sphaerochaetaceae bacterium]
MSIKIKAPEVLAFEKKIVPSDGKMSGTKWEERLGKCSDLKIIAKSVRGTISNRLKFDEENEKASQKKLNSKIENANLQTVDNCSLGFDQDTLKVSFSLKILSGLDNPTACSDFQFLTMLRESINKFHSENGFKEIGFRYACNIASGRFLWRNRVGAEKLEIRVQENESGKSWIFDGMKYDLNSFDTDDENIIALGSIIAEALSGEKDYTLLEIESFSKLGKSQEVYPSQELILDKSKDSNKDTNKKSKVLYSVNSIASMHSQKIGNALRTIDNWYDEFGEMGFVIPVEVYGSVTNLGKAFRSNRTNFYYLFDRFVSDFDSLTGDEKNYVIAMLVRGGVFSKKDN